MGVFLLPNIVWAACVADNATVVYVNGIFSTEKQASADLDSLHRKYIIRTGDSKTKFINGYNPSHLAGVGDITQAAAQTLDSSVSGFDLTTILLQIHPQVTTRKLVLVGHSQGAFYANGIYDYLLAHGEPKAAVGVYHVGTPASSVAGGGKYITSSNDTVINATRLIASNISNGLVPLAAANIPSKTKSPLPANITLSDADRGHGFSSVYLAEAPERVVGDIQGTIKNLKAEWASDTGECFTAPSAGLGYQAAKAGFAVADTAATGIRTGAGAVQVAAVAAGRVLGAAAQGAFGVATKLATDIGITAGGVVGISKASEPESRPTNFDIFSKLYGSSLTKDEYKELLGSAVATAPVFAAEPAPQEDPQITPEAVAPKKITYLSRSHHNNDEAQDNDVEAPAEVAEPEPIVEEVVLPAEPATTTEPVVEEATTTPPTDEPATTTPPVAVPTAIVPALSPVTDSFDSYDGSGWTTYGASNPMVLFATSSPGCHNESSGCIFTGQEMGNGGLGGARRMYKTGTPVNEGSLVIWKKYHVGFSGVGSVMVLVCAGAPDAGGKCDGLTSGHMSGTADVWQQYFLAWRDNGAVKEFCAMRDDTDQSHCSWQPSSAVVAGQAPDTVVVAGNPVRPDRGDRLWFDDLGTP